MLPKTNLRNVLRQSNEEFTKYLNDQSQEIRKSIYIHLLNEVPKTIVNNEFQKFLKTLAFLHISSNYDNEFDVHALHQENDCPVQSTNLIILCCKFNRTEFLKQLLIKNTAKMEVLLTNVDGRFPLPTNKDEEQHNAFYYAMRNGNIASLKMMLEHWPEKYFNQARPNVNQEIEEILAEALNELFIRNVDVSEEMLNFVSRKLFDLRFKFEKFENVADLSRNCQIGGPNAQLKLRIDLVLQNIALIIEEYSDGKEFDEKLLFLSRSLAKDIHVLKRKLKSTYAVLPWEEIEFIIVAFVLSHTKREEINIFYLMTLRENKFFQHLKYFAEKLKSFSAQFINTNYKTSVFPCTQRQLLVEELKNMDEKYSELINDFEEMKDAYSFKKIIDTINLVLEVDPLDPNASLIVIRVLQTVGEYLKNTMESPHLSAKSVNMFLAAMPKNIQHLLITLRNSFSHAKGLIKRTEMFEADNKVEEIQTDLKNVKTVLTHILLKRKMMLLCQILHEVCDIENVDEYMKISKMLESFENTKFIDFEEEISKSFKIREIVQEFREIARTAGGNQQIIKRIEELATEVEKENTLHENSYLEVRMALQRLQYFKSSVDKQRIRLNTKLSRVSMVNIIASLRHDSLSQMANLMLKLLNDFENMIFDRVEDSNQFHAVFEEIKRKKANKDKMEKIIFKVFLFLGRGLEGIRTLDNLKYELSVRDLKNADTYKYELNETLTELLTNKFHELKRLLEKSSAINIEGHKLKAMEMLLLDIVSIMKQLKDKFKFVGNPSYLDYNYPTATDVHLRNYIAHCDPLFEILPIQMTKFVQCNAKKFLQLYETKDFNCNRKCVIGNHDNSYIFKVPAQRNSNLQIITSQQEFFKVLQEGKLENVKKCLLNGGDIKAKDIQSRTALHYGVLSGDLDVVTFLLSFGLNPNCKDLNGYTPFHLSIKNNWTNITKYFLNHSKIVPSDKSGHLMSPLYIAAEYGSADMVKLLLKHEFTGNGQGFCFDATFYAILCRNFNAAIILFEHCNDVRTELGEYLMMAAENGMTKLVQYLIEKGANVHHVNEKGVSALHLAGLMGHYELVKFLLERGARPSIKCKTGTTPFIYACEGNNDKIIKILLEYGADPTTVDKLHMRTGLHMLCIEGNVAGIKLLLQNPNVDVNARRIDHAHPIHFAAEYGHLQIVELLIKAKALVNVKTIEKVTPLHYAAFRGHFDIVKLLVENGAQINCMSENAQYLNYLSVSPLQCAALKDHLNIVKYLVFKGADISVQISSYASELAALYGHTNIVSYFLQKGARFTKSLLSAAVKNISIFELLLEHEMDVNVVDSNGFSLLHFASKNGNVSVVKRLIELGANIHSKTDDGQTSLTLAILENHIGVVKILIQHDALKTNDSMKVLIPVLYTQNRIILNMLLKKAFLSQTDLNQCLQLSVRKGFIDMAILLLNHIDFEHQQNFGADLLFSSIANGNKILTEVILSKGVDINAHRSRAPERTCLLTAIIMDSPDMTSFLIENGANVNVKLSDGTELLHIAAIEGNSEIVKILIDNGANVLAKDGLKRRPIELSVGHNDVKSVQYLLATNKININHKTCDGSQFSLLHIAAQQGLVEMTKLLCQNGADKNAKSVQGSKPIHHAARGGHIKLVEFYLENGMSVNRCADDFVSPLHSATLYNRNSEMIEFLYKKGANLDQIAKDNKTALEHAIIVRNKDIVRTLLNLGAICPSDTKIIPTDDNEILSQLKSVRQLFKAVKKNDFKEVERLVKEEHAQVNAKNDKNETVLVWVSWKGFVESVEMILECGANPNIMCKDNFTALHYAAKFGHFDAVKLLLTHGAIYNIKSTTGKTPTQLTENKEIAKILQTIENCFNWIKSENMRILTVLDQIKDFDILKAILRAKNDKNETIMLAAMRNELPFLGVLLQVKQSVSGVILEEQFEQLGISECFSELIASLKNVRQERCNLFGDDCPGNYQIDFHILKAIYKQGSYAKALEFCDNLYKKQMNILGENSDYTLKTACLKGLILYRLEKSEEALQITESVIQKRKQYLKKNESEYLICLNNLALIYRSLGNHEAALETFKTSLDRVKKLYGKNSGKTLPIENNIALSLRSLGKNKEAIKLFQDVYDRRKKFLGPAHSDTLRTFHHLSVTHGIEGQQGLENLENLWHTQRQSLGNNHLDTLRTQIQLSIVMQEQKKFFLAQKHLNEAIPKLAESLGSNHPEVMEYNKLLEKLILLTKSAGHSDRSEYSSRINIELNNMIDSNKLEEVKQLLDCGADINWKNANGFSPLHFAVQGNHINIVKFLLDKLADPIQTSDKGNTPLHTAASMGHTESVEILLKYVKKKRESSFYGFINGQTANGKMTALHVAAHSGFINVVKILLKNGAIFDLVNANGLKPVNLSTNQEILRLLTACNDVFMDAGANVIVKLEVLKRKENPEFIKTITSARNNQNKSLLELVMNASAQNMMERKALMKTLLELIQ